MDTLDGRATNRYLYRAVYVDASTEPQREGAVGTPGPASRSCHRARRRSTRVTGGDRQITIGVGVEP